jgi:hypothetical protein
MIGLPDGIRPVGFAPVDQFKCFAIRLCASVSQRQQISWQPSEDAIYGPITRGLLAEVQS